MNHFELTESGKKTIHNYLEEMKTKRKEILDAGKDTADDTNLPTEEEIFEDLMSFGFDEDGEAYDGFGVTDNYEADQALSLTRGKDVIEKIDHYKGYRIIPLYANKWCCKEVAGHPEQNEYTYGNIYDDYNDLIEDYPYEDVLYGYGIEDENGPWVGDGPWFEWFDTLDGVKDYIDRTIEAKKASKKDPEGEMRIVSITASPYATQYGGLSVPKDLTGEKLREYIRNHWNEIPFGEPKLDYAGTDFEIEDDLELEEVEERENRISLKEAKEMEKTAKSLKQARNRACYLIEDAKARYIKEKTRARSKKLALERDAIINSAKYDVLTDYDRREDIQEAYGCDCFDETERDRLEDLWDEREAIKNSSVDGIYEDKVTQALKQAWLAIADLWEDEIETAESVQMKFKQQQADAEAAALEHLSAHNDAMNTI